MLALIGKAELVIGMRLHSLIMAANQCVPAVGIVYDPKVAAFASMAGYPMVESLKALSDGDTWARTLSQAWESQDEQRRYLVRHLPEWQHAAWQNVEVALNVLGHR